jgi:parallel beta-helix repeat protein
MSDHPPTRRGMDRAVIRLTPTRPRGHWAGRRVIATRRRSLAALLALALAALSAPHATATPPRTLVVDDDRAQCGQAEYTSIQDAVDAAINGDVVWVCPGLYVEHVSVTKRLTVRGDADTVEAVDCFSSTRPNVDPTTQAIVRPPAGTSGAAVIFDLQANSIELQGLVLTGATGSGSRAITTSSAHSGYRVHHNLIMANTAAAYFRSDGVLPSSFDHNCLRENDWGLANQFLPLIDARIHHNSTFGIRFFTYEQTRNCPEFLVTGSLDTCSGSEFGMDRVVFDHNVSMGDSQAYRFAFSRSTTAFENTVTDAGIGMRLVGANEELQIIDNRLEVRQTGLARQSTPPVPSNFGVLIQGNTIIGAPGTGAGIGIGAGGLKDSQILGNVVTGMAVDGIALLVGNTDNLVRGNTVTNNGRNGILAAAGATGNTFEANQMRGNAVDARDDARPFNVWRGNECDTDIPAGTICGVE